jgi:hypothetical protein
MLINKFLLFYVACPVRFNLLLYVCSFYTLVINVALLFFFLAVFV